MTETRYDTDFYAWTQTQAKALRGKQWQILDIEHLAEEIESLGNEQRHAVRSHLRVVLWHLLKWAYQPAQHSTSWRTSILNTRAEIADRLEDHPSLGPIVPTLLTSAYPRALRLAAAETGLPLATFPEVSPWLPEQVLDDDCFPEAEDIYPRSRQPRPNVGLRWGAPRPAPCVVRRAGRREVVKKEQTLWRSMKYVSPRPTDASFILSSAVSSARSWAASQPSSTAGSWRWRGIVAATRLMAWPWPYTGPFMASPRHRMSAVWGPR